MIIELVLLHTCKHHYSDLPAVQTTSSAAAHSATLPRLIDIDMLLLMCQLRRLILVRRLLHLTTSNSSSSRISAVSYYRMFLLRRLRMLVLLVLGCSFMLHPRYNRSTSRCPSQSRILVSTARLHILLTSSSNVNGSSSTHFYSQAGPGQS